MKTKLLSLCILFFIFILPLSLYSYTTTYYLDGFGISDGNDPASPDENDYNDALEADRIDEWNDFGYSSGTTSADDIDIDRGDSEGYLILDRDDAFWDGPKETVFMKYENFTFTDGDDGYIEAWFETPAEPFESNDKWTIIIKPSGGGDQAEFSLMYLNMLGIDGIILVYTDDTGLVGVPGFTFVEDGNYKSITWGDLGSKIALRLDINDTTNQVTAMYDLDFDPTLPHEAQYTYFSLTSTLNGGYSDYNAYLAVSFNPEPTTILLFLFGLIGLGLKRRKR